MAKNETNLSPFWRGSGERHPHTGRRWSRNLSRRHAGAKVSLDNAFHVRRGHRLLQVVGCSQVHRLQITAHVNRTGEYQGRHAPINFHSAIEHHTTLEGRAPLTDHDYI